MSSVWMEDYWMSGLRDVLQAAGSGIAWSQFQTDTEGRPRPGSHQRLTVSRLQSETSVGKEIRCLCRTLHSYKRPLISGGNGGRMRARVVAHVCTHAYTHAHMHAHTYTQSMHTLSHTHTHTHTHKSTHTLSHTHTRIGVCTHTHLSLIHI